jgi:hypothetical protein
MFFIAILILISFIDFKIYQSISVPDGLKNVPTLSFFELLIAVFSKAGPDKRWENTREILENEGIGKVLSFLRFKIISNIWKRKPEKILIALVKWKMDCFSNWI